MNLHHIIIESNDLLRGSWLNSSPKLLIKKKLPSLCLRPRTVGRRSAKNPCRDKNGWAKILVAMITRGFNTRLDHKFTTSDLNTILSCHYTFSIIWWSSRVMMLAAEKWLIFSPKFLTKKLKRIQGGLNKCLKFLSWWIGWAIFKVAINDVATDY